MGIFCGGGTLTIGETDKSDDESPEIRNHGSSIPTRVTAMGTALYINGGTVDWLSGRVHDNGTPSSNSVYKTGGTFNNPSNNSAS